MNVQSGSSPRTRHLSESDIAKEGRVLRLWGSPRIFHCFKRVSNCDGHGFTSRIRVFGFLCRRLSEQNIPGAPREWMGVSVSIRGPTIRL